LGIGVGGGGREDAAVCGILFVGDLERGGFEARREGEHVLEFTFLERKWVSIVLKKEGSVDGEMADMRGK
jgi:hypothetical protein